jgi:magnesium-transporting ATPase (P-type)
MIRCPDGDFYQLLSHSRINTIIGKYKIYCKGADTVIFERLRPDSRFKDEISAHLEVFDRVTLQMCLLKLVLGLCK